MKDLIGKTVKVEFRRDFAYAVVMEPGKFRNYHRLKGKVVDAAGSFFAVKPEQFLEVQNKWDEIEDPCPDYIAAIVIPHDVVQWITVIK